MINSINVNDVIGGQFVVTKVISGGFAQVLLVQDRRSRLARAIKYIPEKQWRSIADRDQVVDLFLDECYTWETTLRGCPHTVEAVQAFRDYANLGPVLFMEAVDGPSLLDLRRRVGRLSLSQTVRVGAQLAEALAYAHKHDVCHRDIKPSNILLTKKNEVKVIDWGLASIKDRIGFEALSDGYASPQRLSEPGLNDLKDDVYAFGALLFDCLLGWLPNRQTWKDEEVSQPLTRDVLHIPASLVDLIVSALKHNPDSRPQFVSIAEQLAKPDFIADIAKRERELAFCSHCSCVLAQPRRDCPVCDATCHIRKPRDPRTGMVRIEASAFMHGLSEDQVHQALKVAGMNVETQKQAIQRLVGTGHTSVFLPGYDIDRFPVTNAQFDEFCRAMNFPEPKDFAAHKVAFPDHPVVNVTWKDALCYALWVGKRLPLRLEREKAARGPHGIHPYPWGDVWDENRCNNAANVIMTETAPVSTYTHPPQDGSSPYGVADLVGNVREWVSDGERYGFRGLMGGGWSDRCVIEGLVSYHIDADVDYKDSASGFRCAADIIYDEQLVGV